MSSDAKREREREHAMLTESVQKARLQSLLRYSNVAVECAQALCIGDRLPFSLTWSLPVVTLS